MDIYYNIKNATFLIATILIVATGCSADTPSSAERSIDMILKCQISSHNELKSEAELTNGNEIGLFVDEENERIAGKYINLINNKRYVITENTLCGDPVTFNKGKKYKLLAYAPYTSLTESFPRILRFNHGTDVMCAKSEYSSSNTNNISELLITFKHLTAQVTFFIIDERDQESVEHFPLKKADLNISGFPEYYYLDLENMKITTDGTNNSAIIDKIGVPVCISPSPAGDSTKLTLNIKINRANDTQEFQMFNKEIYYKFLPQHSYVLKINLKNNSLSVNGSVVDWRPIEGDELIIKQ